MSMQITTVPYIIVPTPGGGGASPGDTCTGASYTDEMNSLDGSLWTLNDTSAMTRFNGGLWEIYNPVSDKSATLTNNGVVLQGDLDICFAIDVDSVAYNGGAWVSNPYASLYISEGGKGNSTVVQLTLEGPGDSNPGQLYYNVQGSLIGGSNPWTNPPAGVGGSTYHVFRVTKTAATNEIHVFAWNPIALQWEWDGNTSGLLSANAFDQDVNTMQLTFQTLPDGPTNYILCGFDYWYLNVGTVA